MKARRPAQQTILNMATNKKLATGDIQVARAEKQVSMWSARCLQGVSSSGS
jgi:hypothetical protein